MIAAAYRGRRENMTCAVHVIGEGDGGAIPLPLRLDLCSHSPTGFNWGYRGSGPAQLALALAAHALGDDQRALAIYHRLKDKLVNNMRGDQFLITREALLAMIREIETPSGA